MLDLGCGVGVIGISVAKAWPVGLTQSDVNLRALELTRLNQRRNGVTGAVVESDGFDAIDGRFDAILTNPPIRAGKAVIYRLFREARDHLEAGGALFLVIRRQQGAESAVKYLRTLFDSVEAVSKKKGYWVLRCTGPGTREPENGTDCTGLEGAFGHEV